MRIVTLFLIATPLLLLPPYYLGQRLGHGLWGTIPMLILSLCTFAFPFLRGKKWVKISYLGIGFMSFIFVLFVSRDVVFLISRYWVNANLTLGIAITLTLLGLWWGKNPKLKKVIIKIPELPENLKGLTIVQISDLHVGTNITAKYIESVAKHTMDLKPDLIALTGDIGDSESSLHEKELISFKTLAAPLGIFYVPGNHEYYWNMPEWVQVMKRLGAKPLLNEGQIVRYKNQKILVSGITDSMDKKNPPDLVKAKAVEEDSVLKILLAHRPDPAKQASALGFNLQLSGHTHGGQFFPWTLAVRLVHKHHLGLYKVGQMMIYVSGGTGSWGPLLRLGSSAELTHITLE